MDIRLLERYRQKMDDANDYMKQFDYTIAPGDCIKLSRTIETMVEENYIIVASTEQLIDESSGTCYDIKLIGMGFKLIKDGTTIEELVFKTNFVIDNFVTRNTIDTGDDYVITETTRQDMKSIIENLKVTS